MYIVLLLCRLDLDVDVVKMYTCIIKFYYKQINKVVDITL